MVFGIIIKRMFSFLKCFKPRFKLPSFPPNNVVKVEPLKNPHYKVLAVKLAYYTSPIKQNWLYLPHSV